MSDSIRPRRSILYMPGANARAMDKARSLSCDGIVFDLEDAVAAAAKATARQQVAQAISAGGYGRRELIVRVNSLDSEWGAADVEAMAGLPIDGLLFPKVERTGEIDRMIACVDAGGGAHLALWLMLETPRGVLNAVALAAHSPRVACLVMGTSDLVKELRAQHTPSRDNLAYALQICVLAARCADVDILDGVHLDFRNLDSFAAVCAQGRTMGFDGKTLIHPSQVEIANEAYGYTEDQIQHARSVLQIWQAAQAEGKGVAELDGQLIENLHAAEAERVMAFAQALTPG